MITITADNARLLVRFRYDELVIARVKSVPGARWNPAGRCWVVPRHQAAPLRVALRSWDGDLVWVGVPCPQLPGDSSGSNTRAPSSSDWATALFTAVPPHLQADVFRALTRVLHPDTGGDAALMRELLAARDKAQRGAA